VIAQRTRPTSRVHPHQHNPDPDIPADHRGHQRCSTCGLMGRQGDAHHPNSPPLPVARPLTAEQRAAARDRDAAILGERDDQ
jgi:hypothetical protein